MYEHIHIWGDSLGKGVIFDEGRNRYCITKDRCVLHLTESLGMPMVNHCRMGATLPEGYADFMDTAPEAGAPVVIEFGGNDCDMPWKAISEDPDGAHEARVPLAAFKATLRDFIMAVRGRHMLPVLVTPPPLDAQRYFDWVTRGLSRENILRFLGDVQHIYRWQERYALAIRDMAAACGCPLFDMRGALLDVRHYASLVCVDGIHLTAEGQQAVAQAVKADRARLQGLLARPQAC